MSIRETSAAASHPAVGGLPPAGGTSPSNPSGPQGHAAPLANGPGSSSSGMHPMLTGPLPPLTVSCAGTKADDLLELEWLLTNGLGGFASGTAAACPTRRYHALLVAARKPPVDRWALLSSVLVRVTVEGRMFELPCFEFPGAFHPQAYLQLAEIRKDSGVVTLKWQWDGVGVTQEIFMVRGRNTTVIRWKVDAGGRRANVSLMPLAANRNFHHLRRKDRSGRPDVHRTGEASMRFRFEEHDAPELHIAVPGAGFQQTGDWWFNFQMRQERHRGHDHVEDLFVPGWFHTETGPGRETVTMIAGDSPVGPADLDALAAAEKMRRAVIISRFEPTDELGARLADAAQDFIVARGSEGDPGAGKLSVIAGYHWFSDWGRDTFISLPGLLLAGKRYEEAKGVIRTFAAACKDGLIPNRFEDDGHGAEYNTVDAPLWFVHGIGEYFRATRDTAFIREVGLPTCEQIVEAYRNGTKHNIRETPEGLITAGDPNTQLTWMDARCDGISFTPRHGCAIEICALWHHAQRVVAELRRAVGKPVGDLELRAGRTGLAIAEQFWDGLRGYLADVITPDGKKDMSLRPNQLFAVSLSPSPLTVSQQQAVVEVCEQKLLTPFGLRTLAPGHPNYAGRYEGNPFQRDSRYHQGTVWAWLLGPFLEALLRAYDFNRPSVEKASAVLAGIEPHLRQACVGQVSEIFDADAPHTPRGAVAQAWSVAELLRVRHLLRTRRRV